MIKLLREHQVSNEFPSSYAVLKRILARSPECKNITEGVINNADESLVVRYQIRRAYMRVEITTTENTYISRILRDQTIDYCYPNSTTQQLPLLDDNVINAHFGDQ